MHALLKLNILVVEDNPIILNILKCFFARIGYTVDLASNGKQALDYFSQTNYDLIVTDLGLPDMDGIQLVKTIRQIEQKHHLKPALICGATAYNLDEFRKECFEVGFNDLIAKPIDYYFLKHLTLKVKRVGISKLP